MQEVDYVCVKYRKKLGVIITLKTQYSLFSSNTLVPGSMNYYRVEKGAKLERKYEMLQ